MSSTVQRRRCLGWLSGTIAAARAVQLSALRDPQSDEHRAHSSPWLVVDTRCPHAGCPVLKGGSFGGWWCRCHGSEFDTSGRVRIGPAESNLRVPRFEKVGSNTIVLRATSAPIQ